MGDDRAETVVARAYKGRISLFRTAGNLQAAPLFMQDGRYLPEVTISKKDCWAARQPTALRSLQKTGAAPSRPYPAVLTCAARADGTIGRQGPDFRAGPLGTLNLRLSRSHNLTILIRSMAFFQTPASAPVL